MFHLGEYVGTPGDHPASFGRYLREQQSVPPACGATICSKATRIPLTSVAVPAPPFNRRQSTVRSSESARTDTFVQRSSGRLRHARAMRRGEAR